MIEPVSLEEMWLDYAMERLAPAKLDANTLEWLRHAWVAGADAVIRAQMEGDPATGRPRHNAAAREAMLQQWDAELTEVEASRFRASVESKAAGAGQHSADP